MAAVISDCGRYRYTLERRIPCILRWVRPCLFVMLNPSTADAELDDPTIRRCKGFAESWGCSSLTVVNLFALRATDPRELWKAEDPIGPENDRHIREQLEKHRIGVVVVAWGSVSKAKQRAAIVSRMIADSGVEAVHLGISLAGQPKHPLYLPKSVEPQRWDDQASTARGRSAP